MEVSLNLMTSRIGDLLCPQPCGLIWSRVVSVRRRSRSVFEGVFGAKEMLRVIKFDIISSSNW
jgi:hypothetical protein